MMLIDDDVEDEPIVSSLVSARTITIKNLELKVFQTIYKAINDVLRAYLPQ